MSDASFCDLFQKATRVHYPLMPIGVEHWEDEANGCSILAECTTL
jgi:hypothetical protein